MTTTKTQYSGRTTAYKHKFNDWQNHPLTAIELGTAVRPIKVLDAQWSDCPVEVEEEVKQLWRDYDCGNDSYIVKWDFEMEDRYPLIAEFLKERGVEESEECWIHWWW